MNSKLVLALFMGICVVVCVAETTDDELSWSEFVDIMEAVPENDKYAFVKRHVLRGYELSKQGINNQDLDADLKLSLDIFNLVKKVSSDIKIDKVRLETNSEICFQPPIGCIDSGDSGVRPT